MEPGFLPLDSHLKRSRSVSYRYVYLLGSLAVTGCGVPLSGIVEAQPYYQLTVFITESHGPNR